MTHVLDNYLLDIKTKLLHLPFKDQDSIMGEVKAHLQTDIRRRGKEEPGLSQDELELAATAAFGDPAEITVAYGPAGGLVRKQTGEVLLRAAVLTGRAAKATGKAAGRGAKQVLKWTAITALILFLTIVVVGTTLLITYKDTIAKGVDEAMSTRSIYDGGGTWGTSDPQSATRSESFDVSAGADRMDIGITSAPSTGCVAIQLTDPGGTIVYQNGQGCSGVGEHLSLTRNGTWKIQYTYVAFTGRVEVHAIEHGRALGA